MPARLHSGRIRPLLEENPNPTDAEVRSGMEGNPCRIAEQPGRGRDFQKSTLTALRQVLTSS